MKLGQTISDIEWQHVSIWIKQSDWDKLNYMCAASNKNLSAWILDKLKDYTKVPPKHKVDKQEKGSSKSLCFPKDEWEKIKARADECNMSTSKYIINVLFE
jgi:hypothetical protein